MGAIYTHLFGKLTGGQILSDLPARFSRLNEIHPWYCRWGKFPNMPLVNVQVVPKSKPE